MGGISLPQVSLANMHVIGSESPVPAASQLTDAGHSIMNSQGGLDPFMDLLFSGWNPDLPDPGTLNH